ncbi:MAG: nicotinate-nucleotide--dimethylbenzimidazole phosphoribosyltransferase [Aeromonadaceae bacterium]|nr:nicotinate-nucleotide--dimethylbenzimidazole phosphoribosyltransferase [Aeromonadaceae bacterium]
MPCSWTILPLDRSPEPVIQQHIDQKTKPLGALGRLEELACQLALIQRQERITIEQPTMLVFAADHGIARHGISIAPSDVTRQMVLNFLGGGAAINCFCREHQIELKVVDAGILTPIDDPRLIHQRLGAGTADLSVEPAMSQEQAHLGLQLGSELAKAQVAAGCNLLAFGEMGIGNTTPASALLAALTGIPVAACVGRGTGIDDAQLGRKISLVSQALARVGDGSDPIRLLAELGGFEIAQITGAMLAAAEQQITMLIDGFIVTSAALLAVKIAPAARDYMIFSHGSSEGSGHGIMLETLKARPLLDLGLRLGEGTGAALALPLLRSACAFYNEMASFASAGVSV